MLKKHIFPLWKYWFFQSIKLIFLNSLSCHNASQADIYMLLHSTNSFFLSTVLQVLVFFKWLHWDNIHNHVHVWVHGCSVVSNSLWPPLARLLCPWDFPGKNTGVGCHFLFWGSSWPRGRTCISCIAGRFFTTDPAGKPLQPRTLLI